MRQASPIRLEINQKRILNHLRMHGPSPRVAIAANLSIANSALTRLAGELQRADLIEEIETNGSEGRGRPPRPIAIKKDAGYGVGVALHPDWIDIALVDLCGQVFSSRSFQYTATSPEDFASEIERRFQELVQGHQLYRKKLFGFGVSIAGFAQYDARYRFTVPLLSGWRDYDLGEIFSGVLGAPVWVENDANAAALAHFYSQNFSVSRNLLSIFLGYGIGGGCILNGDIFRGSAMNAGSIGKFHPPEKPRPSALDFLNTLRKTDIEVKSLFEFKDFEPKTSKAIRAWINRAGKQLTETAVSGACWFDPELIVIAGTLPNWLVERLVQVVNEYPWDELITNRPMPKIEASAMGGLSCAAGAGVLPIHEAFSLSRGS